MSAFERGMVTLVNSDPTVASLLGSASGGYLGTLPKDCPLPSWRYNVVSDPVDYELTGPVSLGCSRIQIDCFGADAGGAVSLAKAIDAVLIAYRGTLSDGTFVQGVFRTNKMDFFDIDARDFRRMLEYDFCADT